MGLVYLDACLVIYVVEEVAPFAELTQAAIAKAQDSTFVISNLVKAECLVGPLKSSNARLVARFDSYFASLTTLNMDETVFRKAATIRANHSLKLPDALHIACAIHHECEAFWTNDLRLSIAAGPMIVTAF